MSTSTLGTMDRIADRVNVALVAATTCAMLLDLPPDEGRTAHAKREAIKGKEAAGNAMAILQSEGARVSDLPPTEGIPIHLLDTPANRALLAALDAAVQAAELVDAERGFSVPESARLAPDDTLGVDLAEHINQIRARVHLEVHGATGKGME